MFPEVIETDRLRLERLGHDAVDLLELYEVCSDGQDIDEVTQYLSWDPHEHPKETADFLDDVEAWWDDRENAIYVLRPRDPEAAPEVTPRVVPDDEYGPFAGGTGLTIDWDRRLGELGIWLRKPFWGRGYSGERAAALFALAFDRLDLDVVSVSHEPENDRSRRAVEEYVERFGGRREGSFRNVAADADGPVDHVRYSVSQEEWAGHRPDDVAVTFHE